MMAWLRRFLSLHGSYMREQHVEELTGGDIPSLSFGQLLHALVALVWLHFVDILHKIIVVGQVECQIYFCGASMGNTEVKPSLLKLKALGIDSLNSSEHGYCF